MINVAELHADHKELISEIKFLKTEINFLLKLLNKGYKRLVNYEKVKLLDSYWSQFENNIDKLDILLLEINAEEKEIGKLFQHDLIDPAKTKFKEDHILIKNFYAIHKEVKVLKESFYEFMSQDISFL